jgi:hypothetical protein
MRRNKKLTAKMKPASKASKIRAKTNAGKISQIKDTLAQRPTSVTGWLVEQASDQWQADLPENFAAVCGVRFGVTFQRCSTFLTVHPVLILA